MPSICAALGGCDVGNAVQLDRAGEVARRRETGGALTDRNSYHLLNLYTSIRAKDVPGYSEYADYLAFYTSWPAARVSGRVP